jgi:protein-arginine kinase
VIALDQLAARPVPWLVQEGPQADRILSTRVRLARNLRGVQFVGRALEEDLARACGRITDAAVELPAFRGAARSRWGTSRWSSGSCSSSGT